MRNLSRIDIVTGRLDQAAGTPRILAAAWQALEYLREATVGGGPGPQWYAAYLFAAAAAAEARDAAGMAPSMPAGTAVVNGPAAEDEPPGRLAGLAAALAARLEEAAGQAELPGDREAFRLASGGAAQVLLLLAGDG